MSWRIVTHRLCLTNAFWDTGSPLSNTHVLEIDLQNIILSYDFVHRMGATSISEYRKFIFSLSEDLSTANLHSMKFLCRDLLTARELEFIGDSATELILVLEQRYELGSQNLNLLEDLLKQIKRDDLARKLKDFKRKQRRRNDPVVADKQENRFPIWKCNIHDLQDDVTDAKLSTGNPVNSSEGHDHQQAGITPRGGLYIMLWLYNYSKELKIKTSQEYASVGTIVDCIVMRHAISGKLTRSR